MIDQTQHDFIQRFLFDSCIQENQENIRFKFMSNEILQNREDGKNVECACCYCICFSSIQNNSIGI